METVKTLTIFTVLIMFTVLLAYCHGTSLARSETKEESNMATENIRELKTGNGWVSCPKDGITCLLDLHCKSLPKNCPYYKGMSGTKVCCSYSEEEESQ